MSRFALREGRYNPDDADDWLVIPGAQMFVPDVVRRCVLFLGNKDEGGKFHPRATGFVVRFDEGGLGFTYIVTAEHAIVRFQERKWDVWVRSNLKGGGLLEEKWDAPKWWFHPKNEEAPTDVAISPISFQPSEEFATALINGERSIAGTADVLVKRNLGLGDEVFITGLFRSHAGRQRNVPILRVGNLSLMKGEPVMTKWCGPIEAYLIEARSIGGLSGSPVFIHVPPFQVVNGTIKNAIGPQFYLLGLMHGHFDVKDLTEDFSVEDDSDDPKGIHSGIGVVVPVEKIIETIRDDEELAESRRDIIKRHRESRGATPDFADDKEPQAKDANPQHREDFTALVGEAARKQKRGEKT
jgi:hypothetical protein